MTTSGVSLADIAREANVSRACVSNWRARYADFPVPNGGTDRHPTFDPEAVDRWLSSHFANIDLQTKGAAGPPPPLAEPLLDLLRSAHDHAPGVWLPHEQIVNHGIATAHLIRQLAVNGAIERVRTPSRSGTRVLVRLPYIDDTVDTSDIERQANAVLAAVGHRVAIRPARATADAYTATTITHRDIAYTGYRHTRPWTVTAVTTP